MAVTSFTLSVRILLTWSFCSIQPKRFFLVTERRDPNSTEDRTRRNHRIFATTLRAMEAHRPWLPARHLDSILKRLSMRTLALCRYQIKIRKVHRVGPSF